MKKKIVGVVICSAMALALCACGNSGNEKTYTQSEVDKMLSNAKDDNSSSEESATAEVAEEESVEENAAEESEASASDNYVTSDAETEMLTEDASIEETVLVDEADVKITATDLSYDGNPELYLTIENNSDQQLTFLSGTSGFAWNSVNGYMVENAYLNEDVAPGKSAHATMTFSKDEFMLLGIKEISEIQVSFEIENEDYEDVLVTDPVTIQTSIAGTYDYSEESFKTAITNQATVDELNYTVDYYSDDVPYDEGNVQIITESVVTNKDGEKCVILESLNNSDSKAIVKIDGISINGVAVQSGHWTNVMLNPGKKGIISVQLNNAIDKEFLEALGINEIGKINLVIEEDDSNFDPIYDDETITIEIPDRSTEADITAAEILNENGITVSSVGKYEDPSEYSGNIHLLFIVENNADEKVYADVDYDGNSINGVMADVSAVGNYIPVGGKGLVDVNIWDNNLEDLGISNVDEIKEAELVFKATTDDWDEIIETAATVTYE